MDRLILSLILMLPAPGYAYGPCDDDEEKFCSAGHHGETVKVCLYQSIEKVGEECKTFLKAHEAAFQSRQKSLALVREACKDELAAFCAQDGATDKPLTVCLMTHDERLKTRCREDLNRHIKEFLPGIKPLGS